MNITVSEGRGIVTENVHESERVNEFYLWLKEGGSGERCGLYLNNYYLKVAIQYLKIQEKSNAFILEEKYFQSIFALLNVIHSIMIRGDISILIISDRVVDGPLSRFFISEQSPILRWKYILGRDNTSDLPLLYQYYHSIKGGGSLTEKERAVLIAMRVGRSRGAVSRMTAITIKNVSCHYGNIKKKLGITSHSSFYFFKYWLFP